MDTPRDQKTRRRIGPEVKLKNIANRTTVSSSNTSQKPRVQRNRESCSILRPRLNQRNAPTPAVKANVGAHICVIQRVKKSGTVVRVRSSGEKDIAPEWKKSRT